MSLEPALLGYAGLALLAAVQGRTPYRPSEPPFLTSRPAMQAMAILLLALSLASAFAQYGPYQGVVAWIGLLSLGGLALVLLMSRWRSFALGLWLPVAASGLLLGLVNAIRAT